MPKDALNLTSFKGDTPENVAENRRRFLKALDAEGAIIVTIRQTHSTDRLFINSINQARSFHDAGDAMITRLSNVLLGIQTADCLPRLIADTRSNVMAAMHARLARHRRAHHRARDCRPDAATRRQPAPFDCRARPNGLQQML